MQQTLLVGSGQVGQAVAAALATPPARVTVDWNDPAAARAAIGDAVDAFLREAGGQPWALCWTAGRGIVGTPAADLAVERSYLGAALDAVRAAPVRLRATGRLVLASSAGGLHAGDGSTVVTEASAPTPISAYGHHKLLQEQDVAAFAASTGVVSLIGRISNVYGPGQDLRKPQGFISRLCASMLRREGFVLTVPPDTIRDFVYVTDVGRRVAAWLGRPRARHEQANPAVKLLVSGHPTTLIDVIGVVRSVARVPVRITTSPLDRSPDQPLRTRFRSTALPELDREVPTTSLVEGVHRTWQDLLRRRATGTLT